MAKVCFFARVRDRVVLDRVEFYAQDVRILRDLGHEVHVATRLSELVPADLYFCWWWTYAFLPLSVARVLRRPVVITGVFDEWMFDDRPWLQRHLLAWALRAADANIFVSELEGRRVPARLRTTRPSVAPCIVDTDTYSPPKTESPREPLVLTVAWLHADNARRKGVPEIIRAATLVRARMPGVRFVIVGERATGYLALQALARDLGVDDIIDFPGILPAEQKIALMRRCGVYLQPSQFEGFGLAVLEAMSCGAAVVASRGGALPEVVGDAGVVLSDTTPAAIADAVCGLLADPDRARQLGASARARAVSNFPFARRKDALRRVLDHLLEKA